MSNLSIPVQQFLEDIEAVCRKHGFQISPDMYDNLQVWDLEKDANPIYFQVVEDWTIAGRGEP